MEISLDCALGRGGLAGLPVSSAALNRIRNSRKVEMAGNTGFGESREPLLLEETPEASRLPFCSRWQSTADPSCPDPNSSNLGFQNQ